MTSSSSPSTSPTSRLSRLAILSDADEADPEDQMMITIVSDARALAADPKRDVDVILSAGSCARIYRHTTMIHVMG